MNRPAATMLLSLLMGTALTTGAGAQDANGADSIPVADVTALAHVNHVYHQIAAVFVEYPENVEPPAADAYRIEDFATATYREAYDRHSSSVAPIAAIYTNSVPEVRADRTSVEGNYVVIEIEPTSYAVPNADGLYMPNHNAGVATIRLEDDQCERPRTDFSEFVITQNVAVTDEKGNVIAPAGKLPALEVADIDTPELERFENLSIEDFDNRGNSIRYTLYVPPHYDSNKKYPLVFNSTGNGGRLCYNQQDAEGNFVNIGSVVRRDRVALGFTEYEPDSIVVSIQTWRNQPEEWEYSDVDAALHLLDHMIENYSIDTDRIYAFSSSYGGFLVSQMINERPDAFAAYMQVNSAWSVANLPGGGDMLATYESNAPDVRGGMQLFDGYTLETALEPMSDNRLPQAEIDKAKKYIEPVARARVPVWVWHAVNDESISFMSGVAPYEALVSVYQDEGMSPTEISRYVQLRVLEDEEYWPLGIAERHQASKMAVMHPEVFDWLFSQTKK